MTDALRRTLSDEPRVAYALVFGSTARQSHHAFSDVDVAVGLFDDRPLDTPELGQMISRLEGAVGRPVHVILLNDAPPGLAYRVFRDGRPILVRDDRAFKARLARAILEYLDFRPVEELFTRGVLRASHGR